MSLRGSILFNTLGVLNTSTDAPDHFNGGTPTKADGTLCIVNGTASPAVFVGGLGYDVAGRLSVDFSGTPATYSNGLPVTAVGNLCANGTGPAASYVMGIPLTALGAILMAGGSFPLWTPTLVPAEAWFDAQTTSSITQSGTVSQWNDISANARNVEQTVSVLRPTYQATGIGEYPAVFFGVGTCLFSAPGINESQPLEVYSVFRTPAGALPTFSILFDGSAGFAGSRAIAFLRRNDLADVPSSDGGTTNVGFGSALTANTNFLMRHVFNGASTGGAVNAGTETVGSGGTAGIVGSFALSSNPGDPNVAAGVSLGEIVVTPRLSLSNRQRMEGYLAWRWGIEANLPFGHPYKNDPPYVTPGQLRFNDSQNSQYLTLISIGGL